MIKNLLARLLANLKPGNLGLRPHTLSANFAPDSLIAHRSQHNLLERSILHLAPGEAAYLIINGQYTPVYEAGDYPLDPDNIPQAETADILYLNTAATARRPWQSAYQPSQRRLDQPLTGQYTLSIHDPETVCRTIIENQTLELDDDYLDQIISYTIDQSLIHEQVSADDIDYQTEALQNFLKAWLRPQLKPLGLTLHDLRIARRANPPRPQPAPQPVATPAYARESAAPVAAEPATAPTAAEPRRRRRHQRQRQSRRNPDRASARRRPV
ncbi:hypothetical protein CHUV0807_1801 [Cardiobacterium hominis]|uniref:Uncharacterized protein n=1 Tax=Cardiobacterium hominis TaxID=2718 RepID=A0A1C3H5E3_9GAMM|nr:hypothetical protein [Cardiobacterium hominis]SAM67387.1 hypothetical protein CHUV0807_1801 [Cardiobacterium hominis]